MPVGAQRVPVDIRIYADVGQDFAKDGTPDSTTLTQAMADMQDFIQKTFPPPPEPEKEATAKSATKKSGKHANSAKSKAKARK